MKQFCERFLFYIKFSIVLTQISCGAGSDSVVSVSDLKNNKNKKSATSQVTETILGLHVNKGHAKAVTRRSIGGVGADVSSRINAYNAFARATFTESGQTCSGVYVYEPVVSKEKDRFNVYYYTATHCLVKIDPLQRISGLNSNQKFILRRFAGETMNKMQLSEFARTLLDATDLPESTFTVFRTPIEESFENRPVEQLGFSDVARILLYENVDANGETANVPGALPVCPSGLTPPADIGIVRKDEDRPARVVLGWADGAVIDLKLDGASRFKRSESFNVPHKYYEPFRYIYSGQGANVDLERAISGGRSPLIRAYSALGGAGARPTDSGAPVIYATQKAVAGGDPDSFRVSEYNCVEGIVVRAATIKSFDVFGSSSPSIANLATPDRLGLETITYYQNLSVKGLEWKKIGN